MNAVPEDVLIRYTSPSGVQTDITRNVLYADAYFELQALAIPGSFHLTVADPDQSLWFTSGGVIECWIGGTKMFGGFVLVPTGGFFFPADDTSRPVRSRRWSLDGVDFNILLDKRVLHKKTGDNTKAIADIKVSSGNCNDRYIIGRFANYFDLEFSGGNVLDVTSAKVEHVNDFSKSWVWPTLGSKMRDVLDALVIETTIYGETACVYWVDAAARLNWLGLQETVAPWGFSDYPSDGTKTYIKGDGTVTTIPFIGWRDGSVSEDGSSVINDVFVWGGSPLGSNGAVVVSNKDNDASINKHGRWQMAEVRGGETLFKTQASVDARAKALISGKTSGTSPVTGSQGLVNPDTQYTLTWFAHDVPLLSGVRQHLVPGDVTTFNLWSFSNDNGVTPFAIDVPLRQVRITFPVLPGDNAEEDPSAYVEFQGMFGLQMSDSVWWWEFMRKTKAAEQARPVVTTSEDSTTFPYGSYYSGAVQEAPDGSRTTFSIIPSYIAGSLTAYLNGIAQAVIETSPSDGTFTFSEAPVATDTIVVECRTG